MVITGPNTGGKTVALKTVALCCMLAQWGLHVPCQEAWVCMNSQYLCDIGDGQSLSENLSTFSAHITNVLDILSRVNPESLVIMDELGSGTDPTEGMGIAIAILEALRESGCLFLVTTHYPEVKEYAARTQGVTNARMTFDQDSLQPLYRMVIGEAGASCAFAIAERLGMSRAMLDVARQAAYVLHEKLRLDNFRILEDGQIRIYDTHVNLEDLSRTLVLHDVPVTALGRKAQTLESVAPIQGSGKSMLAVSINLFAHLIHIILTGVLVSAFIIDSFKKRTMDLMFSYPIGRKKNPAVPDDLRSFVKLR